MTGVISHKTRRTGWNRVRHSYLVDTGCDIEIQQIEVSDLYESRLLSPPFHKTRYFEIEIDEVREDKTRVALFQTIVPVHAKRKPDWHILKFRIRRGSWIVTERIQPDISSGGVAQWIYTDDLNIMFLSSGGRYDADSLISLITKKLDEIVSSISSGARIPSEFENQQSCRTAFSTMFVHGVDQAFHETVLYHDHARGFPGGNPAGRGLSSTAGTGSRPGTAPVSAGQADGLSVDLKQIDDLQDLNGLSD